ncbi:hypothetical protein D5S17_23280 [Pseudonocardiaceae bacterium YIM PH 21723]|nr:hypothetical protein D5S17_23280 [Pseudonocardiaceae bacterium YIM PH 21723]
MPEHGPDFRRFVGNGPTVQVVGYDYCPQCKERLGPRRVQISYSPGLRRGTWRCEQCAYYWTHDGTTVYVECPPRCRFCPRRNGDLTVTCREGTG